MGSRREEYEERQRQRANQPTCSASHRCRASMT
jgi:hypothetical protein